jgi:hypothetical protein
MRSFVGLLVAGALAVLVSGAYGGIGGTSPVLHDQYDSAGSFTIPSSELPGYPDYGSELADDFVVPSGYVWAVDEVDVGGSWSSRVAFTVRFYENGAGNLPGNVVAERLNQQPVDQGHPGFVVIHPTVSLASGHYWLSMQGDGFAPGQEWRWLDRTIQDYAGAAWRNPGGAYQRGCPVFTLRTACWNPTFGEPDQFFRLRGTAQRLCPSSVGCLHRSRPGRG